MVGKEGLALSEQTRRVIDWVRRWEMVQLEDHQQWEVDDKL